jgi:putative inorganic carbon (hco3(-)) transporter
MTGVGTLPRPRLVVRRPVSTLVVVMIGAVFGLLAVSIVGAEVRWVVYAIVAIGFASLAVVFPQPDQLVWSVFILSFQADVYLRLFYGRAGTRGLPIAFPVVLGCLFLVSRLVSPRRRQRHQRFIWGGRLAFPIAAFLGMSLLTLPGSSERFVGVAQLLVEAQLYFVYLLALNSIQSEEQIERTLKLLLITLAMQSFIYYVESAMRVTFTLTGEVIPETGVVPRPGGTVATNPAGFASFILPPLLIGVAQLMNHKGRVKGLHPALAVLPGIVALTLTFTRAAWVAFALGVSWLLLLAYIRRTLQLRHLLLISGATFGVILVFLPMIEKRLADSPVDEAYEERAGLAKMAIRVIASQPFTGVGPGAYAYTYKAYLTPELRDQWLATVHNAYLLRAAETGIPGGITLVLLLLAGLRQALRLTRSRQPLIRVTATGWSAALIAVSWEMNWDIWRGFTYNALLWFLLGMMEAADRMARTANAQRPVTPSVADVQPSPANGAAS